MTKRYKHDKLISSREFLSVVIITLLMTACGLRTVVFIARLLAHEGRLRWHMLKRYPRLIDLTL